MMAARPPSCFRTNGPTPAAWRRDSRWLAVTLTSGAPTAVLHVVELAQKGHGRDLRMFSDDPIVDREGSICSSQLAGFFLSDLRGPGTTFAYAGLQRL